MLAALEHSQFAPESQLRYPRITCRDLDRWSSAWVRQVWIDFDDDGEDAAMFDRCRTIADLVAEGASEVVQNDDWHMAVESRKGLAVSVSELFRADLDGDGSEEILVFDLTYAPHGTLRAGSVGLARPDANGTRSDCLRYFYKAGSNEERWALASIRRALGRQPDVVTGTYSTRRVSLPSGALVRAERGTAPGPRGFDAATWPEATRFWPGGLVSVDPKRVVAAARAETYKVLPSQMGLSQLIGSGAIERTTSGAFRIVKPIAHLPPSMGGAHSVRLIVAKGVPVPPGNPVHSCVTIEGEAPLLGDARRCSARE